MQWFHALSVGVIVGCSGAPAATRQTTAPEAPTAATIAQPAPEGELMSDCTGETWADYEQVTDYSQIVEGYRFWLRMRRDGEGGWLPAERLSMPLHHASTLLFTTPLDGMVPDGEQRARRLGLHPSDSANQFEAVVYATGLPRQSLEHDATRGSWFATYLAHPECVHIPFGSMVPGD